MRDAALAIARCEAAQATADARNIDISRWKERIERARDAFNRGEFESVEKGIKGVREKIDAAVRREGRSGAKENLAQVKKTILELRRKGYPVGEIAREFNRSVSLYKKGSYDEADGLAWKLEQDMVSLREREDEKRARQLVDSAEKAKKNLPADIRSGELDRVLAMAGKAVEAHRFDTAMVQANRALQTVSRLEEQHRGRRIRTDLGRLRGRIGALEGSGVPVADLSSEIDGLEERADHISLKDWKPSVDSIIKKADGTARAHFSKRIQRIRKETSRYFDLDKPSTDQSRSVAEHIKAADDATGKGDYKTADRELDLATSALPEAGVETLVSPVRSHLERMDKRVKKASGDGIDVREVQTVLADARERLEERNIEGAVTVVENAQLLLERARRNHWSRKIETDLLKAEETLEGIISEKGEPEKLRGMIQKARSQLEDGSYHDAGKTVSQANRVGTETLKQLMVKNLKNKVSTFRERVDEADGEGADVEEVRKILSTAGSQAESGDREGTDKALKKAEETLRSALDQLDGKRSEDDLADANKRVKGAESRIADLKADGVDVAGAEKGLKEAKRHLEEKDPKKAEEAAHIAIRAAAEAQRFKLIELGQSLEQMVEEAERAKKDKVQLEDAISALERARDTIKQGELKPTIRDVAAARKALSAAIEAKKEDIRAGEKKEAQMLLADARERLEKVRERLGDTAQLDALLTTSQEMLDAGHFSRSIEDSKEALSKSRDLLDQEKRRRLFDILADCRSRIGILKGKGVDVQGAEGSINDLGRSYDQDLLDQGLKQGKELKKSIEKMEQAQASKEIIEIIGNAREHCREVRKKGMDTTSFENALKKAEELHDRGELKAAGEAAVQVSRGVSAARDKFLKQRAEDSYAQALGALDRGETRTGGIPKSSEMLKRTKKSLDSGDYFEAWELADRARDICLETVEFRLRLRVKEALDGLMADIREARGQGFDPSNFESNHQDITSLSETGDPESLLKDTQAARDRLKKDYNTYLEQRSSGRIKGFQQEVDGARLKGIETETLQSILSSAESMQQDGKYLEAEGAVQRGLKELVDLSVKHWRGRIDERQKEFDQAMVELEEAGGNAPKEKKTWDRVVRLEKTGSLEGAFHEAQLVLTLAKREVINARRSTAQKIISATEEETLEAQNQGVDVTPVLTHIAKASENLVLENFAETRSSVDQAQMALKKQRIIHGNKLVKEAQVRLQKQLDLCRKHSIDPKGFEKALSESAELAKAGKFEEGINACDVAAGEAASLIETEFRDRTARNRDDILAGIEKAKSLEMDPTFIQKALEEARTLEEEGELERAYLVMADSRQLFADSLKDFEKEYTRRKINDVRGHARDARDIGVNISKPRDLLKNAGEEYKSGGLKAARDLCNKADDLIVELKKAHLKKRATDSMEHAKQILERARPLEIDIAPEEKLFQESQQRFKKEEFEMAERHGHQVVEVGMKKINEFNTYTTLSLQGDTKVYLDGCRGEGVNVTEADELLSQSRDTLKMMDFEEAQNLCAQATERARELRDAFFKKKINALFMIVRQAIGKVEKLGGDIESARELFSEAGAAFEKQDYHVAEDLGNQAQKSARIAEEDFIRKREADRKECASLLAVERSRLQDTSRLGAVVKEPEALLEKAEVSFKEEDFDETRKRIATLKNAIEKSRLAHYHRLGKERILGIRAEMKQMLEDGAPLDEPRNKLEEASKALKDGEFDKVMELAKDAQSRAKELYNAFMSQRSGEEIANVTKALGEIRKIGANTGPADVIIQEARSAFDYLDYKKSITLTKKATEKGEELKRVFQDKQAKERIEGCEAELERLKELKVDVKKPTKILESARLAYHNHEYSNVMKFAQDFDEARDEAEATYESTRASRKIAEAQMTIARVAISGAEMAGARRLLEQAKTQLQKKDFDDSFDSAEKAALEANDAEDRFFSQRASKRIYALQSRLMKLRLSGVDLSKAENLIYQSMRAFETRNYDSSERLCEQAELSAEQSNENHKEQRITELIKGATSTLKEIEKLGADTGEAHRIMEKAREGGQRNDLDLVNDLCRSAVESAEEAESQFLYQQAKAALEKGTAFVREIHARGVDTSRAGRRLEAASTALEYRDFTRVYSMVDESKSLATQAEENHKKRVASDFISSIQFKVIEMSKLGVDVRETESIVQNARELFEKGDYQPIEEIINTAERALGRARQDFERKKTRGIVTASQSTIKQCRDFGANVSAAEAAYREAVELFKKEDFVAAREMADKAKFLAEEGKRQFIRQNAMDGISSSLSAIKECRELGINVTDAEKLHDQAEDAFKAEDYDKVTDLVRSVADLTVQWKMGHFKTLAEESVNRNEELCQEVAKQGADVSGATEILANAQKLFSSHDYQKCISECEKCNQLALRIQRTHLSSVASETITAAQTTILEAKGLGANVGETDAPLKEAMRAFENSDFIDSKKQADRALGMAKEAKRAHLSQQAAERIAHLRDTLKRLRELGLDSSKMDKEFEGLKEVYASENYQEAGELALELEKTADQVERRYMVSKAMEDISKARNAIDDQTGRGVDMTEPTKVVEKARAMFDSGNYKRSIEYVSEAHMAIESAISLHHQKRAKDLYNQARGLLKDLATLGQNIEEGQTQLKRSKRRFQEKKYEEAASLAQDALDRASELKKQHDLERSSSSIQEVRDEMIRLGQMGVAVDKVEEVLERAREAQLNEDFELAIDHARTAKDMAVYRREEFIKDTSKGTMDYVSSRLAEIKNLGADPSEAERLVNEVRDFLREIGDIDGYLSAIEKYKQKADDVVNEAKNQYTIQLVRQELKNTDSMLSDVTAIGGERNHLDVEIKHIESALEFQRYEKAKEMSGELLKKARSLKEDQIGATHKNLEELLDDNERLGISTTKDRQNLSNAHQLLGKRQIDKSFHMIVQLQSTVEKRRDSYFLNKATEEMASIEHMVEQIIETGFNVLYSDDLLERAKEQMDKKDFKGITESVRQTKEILERSKLELLRKNVNEKLPEMEEQVKGLKEYEIDTKNLEKEMGNARLFVDTNPKLAEEHYNTAVKMAKDLQKTYFKTRAAEIMSTAQTKIEFTDKMGAETEDARSALDDARQAAKNGDYERATLLANMAVDHADKSREAFLKKHAQDEADKVQRYLSEVKGLGVLVQGSVDLLQLAMEEISQGEIKKAMGLISEAREKAEKNKEMFIELSTRKAELFKRIEANSRLGINVDDVSVKSQDMDRAFQSGDYIKALEACSATENVLKRLEREHTSKMAQENIKTAEHLLGETEKRGVDVKAARKILQSAVFAVKYEDFTEAINKAKAAQNKAERLLEEFRLERTKEIVANAQKEIESLAEMGVKDPNVANLFVKAEVALKDEKYSVADKYASDAMKRIDEAKSKIFQKQALETLTKCKNFFNANKGKKMPLKKPRSRYEEAKALYKEGSYTEARDSARELLGVLNETLTEHDTVKELLEETATLMIDVKNSGGETGVQDTKLQQAKVTFENLNYKVAQQMAREVERELKNTLHNILGSKAKEALASAEKLITNFRKGGVDVSLAEKSLQQSSQAYQQQRYNLVSDYANKARELAQKAKIQFELQKLQKEISELDENIQELELRGGAVGEAKILLDQALFASKYEDFDNTRSKIKALKEELEKSEIKLRTQQVSFALYAAEQSFVKSEQYNFDITPGIKVLSEAETLLENQDFDGAVERAGEAKRIADGIFVKEIEVLSQETIRSTRQLMDDLVKKGAEIEEPLKILEEASKLVEQKRFEDAIARSKDAIREAEKSHERLLFERADQEISEVQSVLDEIKEFGFDVSTAEEFVLMAESAAGMGKFTEVEDFLKKAQNALKDLREEYNIQRAKDAISYVEFVILNVKDFGVRVPKAERILKEAKFTFADGKYEESEELAKKAESIAKEAKVRMQTKRAREALVEAKSRIQEIRDFGVDVSEALEIYYQAETALNYGQFEHIDELLARAEDAARRAQKDYMISSARSALEPADAIVAEIKSMGIDVKEEEEILSRAHGAFRHGNFDEVIVLASNVNMSAKEKKRLFLKVKWVTERYMHHESMLDIEKVEDYLSQLMGIGLDVTRIELMVQQAKYAYEDGNEEEVQKLVSSAIAGMQKIEFEFMSKNAMDEISRIESIISDMKDLGVDTTLVERQVAEAKSAFEYRKYTEAISLAKKADGLISKAREGHVVSRLLESILETQNTIMIEEFSDEDMNVIDGMIRKAKDAFKQGQYSASEKLIEGAKEHISKVTESRIVVEVEETVRSVKEILEDLKSIQAETSHIEKMLVDSKKQMDSKDYARALETAFRAKEVALDAKHERRITGMLDLILDEARDRGDASLVEERTDKLARLRSSSPQSEETEKEITDLLGSLLFDKGEREEGPTQPTVKEDFEAVDLGMFTEARGVGDGATSTDIGSDGVGSDGVGTQQGDDATGPSTDPDREDRKVVSDQTGQTDRTTKPGPDPAKSTDRSGQKDRIITEKSATPGTDKKTHHKADGDLEVDPKMEPKVEPEVDPKMEPKVEPEVDPKMEPKVEPEVDLEVNPEVEGLPPQESSDLDRMTGEIVEGLVNSVKNLEDKMGKSGEVAQSRQNIDRINDHLKNEDFAKALQLIRATEDHLNKLSDVDSDAVSIPVELLDSLRELINMKSGGVKGGAADGVKKGMEKTTG